MTFKVADKIPDVCCKGYDWEIIHITESSYWGGCENPNCSQMWESDCIWNRISCKDYDDLLDEVEIHSEIGL